MFRFPQKKMVFKGRNSVLFTWFGFNFLRQGVL